MSSKNPTLTVLLTLLALAAAPLLADPPPGYYDSVDATSSTTLRSSLHPVVDDHSRYPYTSSSTDVWDILADADEDPFNSSNVIDVYKNASYTKITGGTGAYNREHTWPKSLGFPNDNSTNYAYTDCHHLFASDSAYNSSRGNKPFDDCTSGCTEEPTYYTNGRGGPGQSNWTDSGRWQVWSGRKGDVARAMFYMDVRYEGGTHNVSGATEPDLRLTDNAGLIVNTDATNGGVAYMGLLSTLLQWHAEDPVDVYEQYRNDMVATYQGNRNPFVDHPEWVDCLFKDVCSGGGGGGSTLANGVPKTGLNATAGGELRYTLDVPSGASGLSFAISGGSGDADLYVKFGSQPTTSSYDCRPYLSGNDETCNVTAQAGTWYVMVRAYSAFSGVSLTGSYTEPGGGGSCGGSYTPGTLSGSAGSQKFYYLDVDSCADTATFTISGGSGDADLYVKFGSQPTTSSYDCRPYLYGNDETCTFSSPSAGRYWVMVRGYSSYSGLTLLMSYE